MTITEIHTKAGGISRHLISLLLIFGWYFLENIYQSMSPELQQNTILILLDWAARIFLIPSILAGVYGAVYEQQRSDVEWSIGIFLRAVKSNYWRIMGANLLAIAFLFIVTIIVAIAGGMPEPALEDNKLGLTAIYIPYAALNLFWLAAIVLKRKIFRGLSYAIKTLLTNPFALTAGLIWGVVTYIDSVLINNPAGDMTLAINGVSAAVVAAFRVAAILYVFAIYRQAEGELADNPAESIPSEPAVTSPGDGLVKASFGFSFVSFLPLLHLVALVLGILALKRKKSFSFRAAIACCAGGFFTIVYALLITGWMLQPSIPITAPGYAFLLDANPTLKPQVQLLEQGVALNVQQIELNIASTSEHDWASDTVLAFAKYQAGDSEGAIESFSTAAEKNPERAEFYYYFGLLLLENDRPQFAITQFENALEHDPGLKSAERYLTLINNRYEPSKLVSALLSIFILLILFTIHEYGHALAAWKLGDNTAQLQGRLTLNPLPHLDLFGSVLLPALLIWQQSEIIFGWAKPVPVIPANFKDPQKDHMRVSFAGPAMNLIITMLSFVLLGGIMLGLRLFWPETLALNLSDPASPMSIMGPPFARWLLLIILFLKQLFYTSLVLGCLNLIPIPPLDGSWIFSGLLPRGLSGLFEKTRQFGFLFFVLLSVTHILDYILGVPVGVAWGVLQLLVSAMGFG